MKNQSALRKRKNFLISLFSAVLFASFAAFAITGARSAALSAADVFAAGADIRVEADYAAPEKLDGGKKGVLLSAEKTGASVRLAADVSGEFSASLRVFSDPDFGGDLTAYKADPFRNDYLDLRTLRIRIADAVSGEYFDIVLDGGEPANCSMTSARVEKGNSAVGYYYEQDAVAVAMNSAQKNSVLRYTLLGGTSFDNVVYLNGELTDSTRPVEIRFDPATMRVYGMHYGYNSADAACERLIADLSDPAYFMACDLAESDFLAYSVSFIFDDIENGRTGKVLVYDVNGQPLSGKELADEAGAQVAAAFTRNYAAGEKIPLPEPVTYDLTEGKAAKVEVCIKDGDGGYVPFSSGRTGYAEYTDDLSFTPVETGEYSAVYRAYDSAGRQGKEFAASVKVVENGGAAFITDAAYPSRAGVGSSIYLAPAEVRSEILFKPATAEIEIDFDGRPFAEAEAGKLFILGKAGVYTVRYTAENGRWSQEYDISVTENEAGFALETPLVSRMAMGATLDVPDCRVTYRGGEYAAIPLLIAPDGSATASRKATLSQRGSYTLVYTANIGGVMYSKHYKIESAFSNDRLFTAKNGAELAANADSSSLVYGYNGVLLSSESSGASAVYNGIIDLNGKTSADPLLEAVIVPSAKGTNDFGGFTVTLTDIYDEENTVTIEVKAFSNPAYSITKAAAAGQVLTGRYNNVPNTRSDRGYVSFHSFSGEGAIGFEPMTISIDYAERSVHVSNPLYTKYGDCAIDLDSADDFPGSSWGGFAAGKCRMEIKLDSVAVGGTAQMLLLNVDGKSLSGAYTADTEAPELTIDTLGYAAERLPQAEAGKEYPLFKATAYDRVDGEIKDISATVYKDYRTEIQREIAVKNGAFTPESAGEYSIVYAARDFAGNVRTGVLKVQAADSLEKIALTLAEEPRSFYAVGEVYEVPEFTLSGGSGEKTAEVSLLRGGEVVEKGFSYYRFEEEGDYVLRYTAVDYLGTVKTFDHDIAVAYSDAPIAETLVLPEYLVDGFRYEFPALTADNYTAAGVSAADYDIYVACGGKEEKLGKDRMYTPEASVSGEELKVKYVAYGAGGKTSVQEHAVKVLKAADENGLIMSQLFAVTEGAVRWEAERNSLTLITDGALKLRYANAVLANEFGIMFDVPENRNAFGRADIVLTDSENKDITVRISVYRNAADTASCRLAVNGGEEKYSVIGSFFDNVNQNFYLSYDGADLSLKDESSLSEICRIEKTEKGKDFGGFPSGKVNIGIELYEVSGDSALSILQSNNQGGGARARDGIAPQLELKGNIPLECDIGDTIDIPAARAADVIQTYVDLRVIVTDPAGGKAIDNVRADVAPMQFAGDHYGVYTVVYTATDGAGKSASLSYSVYVRDKVPPVLEITGKWSKTGKVGKAYKLPAAVVSDNVTEELKIYIFCLTPSGGFEPVEGGSYTFAAAGKYTFRYFAKDGNYNYAYQDIEVEVK